MKRLFEIAHDIVREVVKPGDVAIDATAGNGFDTRFLARLVGPAGHVFAFDIQADAIAATTQRMNENNVSNVALLQRSHDEMIAAIPVEFHSRIAAVMFNLGYRPGSPQSASTLSDTTLVALAQAYLLLKPSGIMTVIAYREHPGGDAEMEAVEAWLRSCVAFRQFDSELPHGPRLYVIRKPVADALGT